MQQDDGSYVLNTREELSGTTGQTANVTLKDFSEQGYSEGQYAALTIAGDGSTVVKVRYEKTDLHTATFYTKDEAGKDVVIGKAYYYLGKTIEVPQSVYNYKPGFVPVWETGTSFTGTAEYTEIWVSDWLEGEGTPYKVEHWVQNADDPDEYELVQTDNKTGTTNGPVEVTLMEYDPAQFKEGTYDTSLTIDGAGTTVVEVKYDRCVYTLTYDLNAGDDTTAQFVDPEQGEVEMRFGQTITLLTSADVQREGHALTGWTTDAAGATEFTGTTMPADDLTLYAVWEEGVPYKVINILQAAHITGTEYSQESGTNISYGYEDRDYYDEVVENRVAPTTGQQEIAATERDHYVTPESQSVNILADGTTVVTFEYA